MKSIDASLILLLAIVVLLHLALAPYTKVEESFNIQAAHDVLLYGTPSGVGAGARLAARYDHFAFPGAVPRSFVGATLLAGLANPVVVLLDAVLPPSSDNGMAAQMIVRAVLGLANVGAMAALAQSLARACGASAARWYLLLQLSQFHCMFYASRTLPNMFAFCLTTLAWAHLVSPQGQYGSRASAANQRGRVRVAVSLLVLAGVVFRAEVALLLATVAIYLVIAPLASVEQLLWTGLVSAGVALVLSVPLDTYFWQRPPLFWPELHGFVFNVLHGQASQWGTSPPWYYFVSALPKLLLNPLVPLVLIPWALRRPATRGPARLLVVPSLLFVGVYSLQPHKEARFVLYVVPALTAAAALGADQLTKEWAKAKTSGTTNKKVLYCYSLAAYATALSVPASFAISTAMLLISALNYPGGEALAILRSLVRLDNTMAMAAEAASVGVPTGQALLSSSSVVAAHVDVLACMTGVTLFGSALGPALPQPQAAMAAKAATAALAAGGGVGGGGGFLKVESAWTPGTAFGSGPQLLVDKTEDKEVLADPAFWAQFDYVLAEDPKEVGGVAGNENDKDSSPLATTWKTIAVVQGFAGIEVLGPHRKEEPPSVLPTSERPVVVGSGATVAAIRRLIQSLTGGWYVGPRMAPRIYILRRVKAGLKVSPDSASTA